MRTGDARNSHTVVTLASLRTYVPELFDRKAEGLEMLRQELAEYRQDIAELKKGQRAIASRVRMVQQSLPGLGA
jgi:hypothetical protein